MTVVGNFLLMQAAERVNQREDRKRHTEQPQQQITSDVYAFHLPGLNCLSLPASEGLFLMAALAVIASASEAIQASFVAVDCFADARNDGG
jgi:hypothetical protein